MSFEGLSEFFFFLLELFSSFLSCLILLATFSLSQNAYRVIDMLLAMFFYFFIHLKLLFTDFTGVFTDLSDAVGSKFV